jgi:hypothetical protein
VHQYVHGSNQWSDLVGADQTDKAEMLLEPRPGDLLFERLLQNPSADKQKPDLRTAAHGMLGCLNHIRVSFEMEESGDLAHHDVIFGKRQFPPHPLAMLIRLKKRLHLHPAVDRRELLARGHTGGDQLVGHGVRYTDKVMALVGGERLAATKEIPGNRILEFVKRGTMHCVNHCRNAQRPGGDAAEQSALGAMGVHYLRAKLLQDPLQFVKRAEVPPGMNRTPQSRNEPDRHPPCPQSRQQIPLGAQRRAGDQQRLVAVYLQRVAAAQESILLGTPDDHAGNHVSYAHPLA